MHWPLNWYHCNTLLFFLAFQLRNYKPIIVINQVSQEAWKADVLLLPFHKGITEEKRFSQSQRGHNRAGKKPQFPVLITETIFWYCSRKGKKTVLKMFSYPICGLRISKKHQPLEIMSILKLCLFQWRISQEYFVPTTDKKSASWIAKVCWLLP